MPIVLAAILVGDLPIWRKVIVDLRNRTVGAHGRMSRRRSRRRTWAWR